MSSAKGRIDELDGIQLNTSVGLEKFTAIMRGLYKDIYLMLDFAAEELQRNLATMPVADAKYSGGVIGSAQSRIRARRVANNLRRASQSSKYAGGQTVKTWREFTRNFAPEIEAKRLKANGAAAQRGFKVNH